MTLYMEVPHFPPSVNRLYIKRRNGGMLLSDEAKAFKNAFSGHLMSVYLPVIAQFIRDEDVAPTVVYRVEYDFYFPRERVVHAGYGSTSKSAAKTPYAKMDVENLLKLISDCLAKAISIDDSRFFSIGAHKHVAKENEARIRIAITATDPSVYGIWPT